MARPTIVNFQANAGTVINLSFTPTAGNLLVVGVGRVSGTPTCVDNEGGSPNPWTLNFVGGGNPNSGHFSKVATGNETTITTTNGGVSPVGVYVYELTPSEFVQAASGRSTTPVTTGSITVDADSIVITSFWIRNASVNWQSWTNATDQGAVGEQRTGYNNTATGSNTFGATSSGTFDLIGLRALEYRTPQAVVISVDLQTVSVSTQDINVPLVVGSPITQIDVATQNPTLKENLTIGSDLQTVVINTQNADVIADDVQTIDLQTVSVSTQNANLNEEFALSTDTQSITITTREIADRLQFELQNVNITTFEGTTDDLVIADLQTVSVNTLNGLVLGDVFVEADLQTISITTNTPNIQEFYVVDAQSITVTPANSEVREGIPTLVANVNINTLTPSINDSITSDIQNVTITTKANGIVTPPGLTYTYTSSVYQPVAITSRHVDLQFVTDDTDTVFRVNTYGSPRSV